MNWDTSYFAGNIPQSNIHCSNYSHTTAGCPFRHFLPDAAQKHGLVEDIKVDKNGMVHAPTNPGLGYEIDFDLIEHNKVSEI